MSFGIFIFHFQDTIPTNTLMAFLSMLFCCFCIGFMALGASVRAKECKMRKQYYGAKYVGFVETYV